MNRQKTSMGGPMRMLIAGLALAMMTAAAQAQMSPQQNQMNGASRLGQGAARQGEDKTDKPKVNDKAYNAALHNLPDKPYDPWHGVR
jgi:opacity protein-like surface antigen